MGKLRTRRLKAADPAPARPEPLPIETFDSGRVEDALETLRRQTKMMQVKVRVLETAAAGGVAPVRTNDDHSLRETLERERAALETQTEELERRLAEADERAGTAEEQLEHARKRETIASAQAEAYGNELARLREIADELQTRNRAAVDSALDAELTRGANAVEEAVTKLTVAVASLQGEERTRTELTRAAAAQAEAYQNELARLRELADELETRNREAIESALMSERNRGANAVEEAVTKLGAVVASLEGDERTRGELTAAAAVQAEAYENELARLRELVGELETRNRNAVESALNTELSRGAHAVDDAVAKLTAVAASIQADESARADLARRAEELTARATALGLLEGELAQKRIELDAQLTAHQEERANLGHERKAFEAQQSGLKSQRSELEARRSKLERASAELEQRTDALHRHQAAFEAKVESVERDLALRAEQIAQRERASADQASAVEQRTHELSAQQRALESAGAELVSERAELDEERMRFETEKNDTQNERSQLEQRRKELERKERQLAERAHELNKRERKLQRLDEKARSVEEQAQQLSRERAELATQTRAIFEREQKVQTLEGRERALLTAAADLKQRQEEFAARVSDLEQREADHARERDELARRIATLASELRPQSAGAETPHDEPQTAPKPSATIAAANGSRWNIDELERLVEERTADFPEQSDDWRYTLFYLRPLAGTDGLLPSNLASVVEETFGELIR